MMCVLLFSPDLYAGVAEEEAEVSSELLYRIAIAHLYEHGARIHLSDETAGIMKFHWKHGGFEDDDGTIEVIPRGLTQSKLRVTFPKDFGGRTHMLLRQLLSLGKEVSSGTWGKSVRGEADAIYRAALRFVLKSFVSPGLVQDDVVRLAEANAGLIQFVYRESGFSDSETRIQVFPMSKHESRIHVSMPADPGRKLLLEQRLLRSIKEDFGNDEKDHR